MSAVADAARDYLQLRNSLGHDLAEHHGGLPRSSRSRRPGPARRHRIRGAGLGAGTRRRPGHQHRAAPDDNRPRLRPLPSRHRCPHRGATARADRRPPPVAPPFIYRPGDIEALMAQARRLTPMPAATHETLIGLLAATGLRVGK